MFVRAELLPPDNNKESDICNWRFIVDQDIVPEWYDEDPIRYENEFRSAVAEWIKTNYTFIAGMAWTAIKKDQRVTYYLLDDILDNMEFGANNNYSESEVRKTLNNSALAEKLKMEFGERLVPISTNLLSLDGLNDYGTVKGDILAIPNLDLYRECRKKIPGCGRNYWLATPDSTPSGWSSSCVLCVDSGGGVRWGGCDYSLGVRPFFILKSDIFES